jgi:ribosome-binding factor A
VRIRPERVAHLMRREIADIVANRMSDPRLSSWVSVTDVEVTSDLSFARVYVSVMPAEQRDEALRVLQGAAGFVRRELAPRLGLREVPDLRFMIDRSIETGARVVDILRRLHDGEPIDDDDA